MSTYAIKRIHPKPVLCGGRAFTVLELLVVVGVLSMLLAIMLPTIKTVHTGVLKNRAQVEATALAQAAIRYKTEYGFWPGQLEEKGGDSVALRTPADGDRFIPVILSCPEGFKIDMKQDSGSQLTAPLYLNRNEVYQAFRRVGDRSGERYDTNPLNPKGIHFLDLKNEGDRDDVEYPDPWGRDYILFMGLNPGSVFTHKVIPKDGSMPAYEVHVSNTVAFAFSYGPKGESSTNYIYSAGVR